MSESKGTDKLLEEDWPIIRNEEDWGFISESSGSEFTGP